MPRSGVQFINNDEPSFIKQFKQRIGHKDEANVETKKQIPNFDEDGEDSVIENDDEKPVVVVLKEGDLTQEEAKQYEEKQDEGQACLDKKITFKKPTKRSKEDGEKKGEDDGSSSNKSKKTDSEKDSKSKDKLKTKNTKLLSFGDDDE